MQFQTTYCERMSKLTEEVCERRPKMTPNLILNSPPDSHAYTRQTERRT